MAFGYDITNAPPSESLPYGGTSGFTDLYNQIVGAAPQWTAQGTTDKLAGMASQFSGMFQNMVGRPPTNDELSAMFSNIGESVMQSPAGYGGTSYADFQNLMNPYIQNTYGKDIQANQQSQSQSQLNNAQNTIQNLIKNQTQTTASDLLNPNSPTYQQFSGMMNNMGISPSSGAFQQGLGGTLGQAAANNLSSALGAVTLPAISGQLQMGGAPYQMALQQMYPGLANYGSVNSNLYDFQLQSALAKNLADESQPSGFEKGLGYASAGSNVLGNLSKFGPSNAGTSYVCMELIKRGLLCDMDMDDFHVHIMPAMFKKARAFWKYAADGWRLVEAVNAKGLDWKAFKPLLFDRVIEEPDPCKAVDLYADACHQLCISADRSLWDPKVYKTGFWDSLRFLPRLFFYTPFIKALFKCIRIKFMILYDKPRCGLHGAR